MKKSGCLAIIVIVMIIFLTSPSVKAEIKYSGICGADGNNLSWVLTTDRVLIISGTGMMQDYESPNGAPFNREHRAAPFWNISGYIDSVVIERGVTGIGKHAFDDVSFESVVIPDSVTSIREGAFQNCSFESIIIPDSVTSIGEGAFRFCDKLTSISIPSKVKKIEANTFENCASLLSVNIPDGVESIGESAFSYCYSLKSIDIPDSVTNIGDSAFYQCDKLKQIQLSDNLTNIGTNAFSWCTSLSDISIPASVTNIGDTAFYYCPALTCFRFYGAMPHIGSFTGVNSSLWLDAQTVVAYYPYTWPTVLDEENIIWIPWDPKTGEENVKRDDSFKLGRDTNSFSHYYDDFGYDSTKNVYKRYGAYSVGTTIPTSIDYYNLLLKGLTNEEFAELKAIMNKGQWGGSCFGLELSMIMSKLGKLNYSAFLGKKGKPSCYSDLRMPAENIDLRNAINYYQLLKEFNINTTNTVVNEKDNILLYRLFSQSTFAVKENLSEFFSNLVREVKNASKTNTPFLFLYSYLHKINIFTGSGHAIILTGNYREGKDYYIIECYDCNIIDSYIYLFISKDYEEFYFGSEPSESKKSGSLNYNCTMKTWMSFDYISPSEIRKYADFYSLLDVSVRNAMSNGASNGLPVDSDSVLSVGNPVTSGSVAYTCFTVDADKPFMITNAEGKYLKYDGTSFGGDMEVKDIKINYDENLRFRFFIPKSESFIISNIASSNFFSLISPGIYLSGSVGNADRILVSNKQTVIEGENYSFDLNLLGWKGDDVYSASGTATTKSSWSVDTSGISMQTDGQVENLTMEYIDDDIKVINDLPKTTKEVRIDTVGTVSKYSKVGDRYVDKKTGNKYIVSSKKEVKIIGTTSKQNSLIIPATISINGVDYKVSAIGEKAFKNNKKITTVTIGKNVKTIGKNAFNGCTKLKTVKGCKGVTSIGASAFQGCSKLTSMAMGAKLTTIGDKAFYKCTALTKITIPAKVTKIGKSAFQGCKKLKTITIKTTKLTAKKVGAKAFTGTVANATVKAPKKSLKAYKTWLVKKGINKKAKIKS